MPGYSVTFASGYAEVVFPDEDEPSLSVSSNNVSTAEWTRQENFREDLKKMIFGNISLTDSASTRVTDHLAIDCEMVGVGPRGAQSELVKVCVVNQHGFTLYEKFVRPRQRVTDWRHRIHGIGPECLNQAISFKEAQYQVDHLIGNNSVIGHAVIHDLDALEIRLDPAQIKDTQCIAAYQRLSGIKRPALRRLVKLAFDVDIQQGFHDPAVDARAALALYLLHERYPDALSANPPAPPPQPVMTTTAELSTIGSGHGSNTNGKRLMSELSTRAELRNKMKKMVWGDVLREADQFTFESILAIDCDLVQLVPHHDRGAIIRFAIVDTQGVCCLDILTWNYDCEPERCDTQVAKFGVLSHEEGLARVIETIQDSKLVGHGLSDLMMTFDLNHRDDHTLNIEALPQLRQFAQTYEPTLEDLDEKNCRYDMHDGMTQLNLDEFVRPMLGLHFDKDTPTITKARAVMALYRLYNTDSDF